MPHSARDSDDDVEPKGATGRMQTRNLTVQSVNSPLRRSSRIKQTKCSPGSESDSSSINSTQTARSSRTRTATVDSIVSDTKKLRTRKPSISSEISETMDVDAPRTPGKRTTRQSTGAATLGTPTRVNTRAASKRFMRAGSETKSPLPAARTTRRTRASSIDPESLSNQNKNQFDSPIKTRKRTSLLSLDSLVKEQIESEDRIPYVRLDATIVEIDEITSSEKVETSTDSLKSNETLQLEKETETQTEDVDRATVDVENKTLDEGQYCFEKTLPTSDTIDEVFSIHDSSSDHQSSSVKEDKVDIVEENLSNVEKSLINTCESTKELGIGSENLFDTSIEEEKSNKENQMLNIIRDVSTEKSSMQPNVTSYTKSLASPFMNKSSGEKEPKSKKERSLSKRRCSRESTEKVIKHSDFSKETIDNSQEMMDISIESSDSIVKNKTVLSQHDSIELVDKVIDKDETPIENISTSTCNENAEVISKSDKIDKIECIITDSKNPKKTELNEVDKTSCSSTTQVKLTRRSNSRESLISNLTTDDNEIKLVLEEHSSCRDEVSSNVAHSKPDDSVDLQISLLVNESSDDRPTGIDKQSAVTQDEVIDRTDSTEQEQKNLSKHITESASKSSNDVLETNNSACDDLNDTVIQNNQFPDVKAAEDCVMDISLEKTDAKDISSKKIVKQNLKRKCSDVLDLDAEKESSQMDTSQKDQEKMEIADDTSDVNIGIDLFQNILADKWKEKNDVKTDLVQSIFQSVEDEAECDLILVDKRAWLAAETIKAVKEIESFEYDSDDTVLLKSRSDAAQARYDAKKLDPVSEEPLTDIEDEENEKQVKKRKPRTKRRLTSEIDQDSSRSTEDEDKSLNESKTALNRTNRFISKLNKSEQSARTRGPSKANDESNEEIEDDASEFNRSPIISKRNTTLRKSMEGRPSLNKSKDMQNISANKLRTDNSEEEFDNTDAHAGQKLYKKKLSLNKSCNKDADDVIESEKKNVSIKDNSKKDKNTSLNRSVNQESKPINIKTMIHLNDDESDDSDINLRTMNLGSKAYSMIANAGSDVDCTDEYNIPGYIFATSSSSDDTDDNSCDSDINKEYNLDGVEPKFSDDDVAADECRASETEVSDSDDNGSDLADFIDDYDYVDDYERYDYEDEEKVEEEEDDDGDDDNDNDDDKDDDDQNMKEDDKNGNEQNVKEDEATEKEEMEDEEDKQAHIVRYTEPINMESEDGEDDKNVQEKDGVTDKEENKFTEIETTLYASTSKLPKVRKSKDKSIEYISPHRSETEMKRDIKMKKSNIKKNEKTILLDSSDSDLSSQKKKKKSLVEENEINLLDTSNSISSSTKKKRKSDSQYFSGDGAERNSSKQLNESELMSTKRLSKSRIMEFSTPNLNTCKKFELDETFERNSESEDIKLDNTIKTMKDTSVTKKKSKKDPMLNKDINLKKFNYASKEKLSIRDLSPDLLELLHKTVSTSSKMELYKTMSICDSDTPTIKHLRKEKLNESAPVLSNTETHRINSLWKDLFTENVQHTAQRKIKEKNKDQVSHLITSNDDTIQKHSQKKQKKRNKQQTSKEDITDETLSEDAIELKIPKKKKRAKLTQLAIVEDDARKDTCQIIEKKKKQETSKENVTDEVLSEDAIELKIPKKKKRAKLTQLAIAEDNAHKDTCQIIEKKKKQETSKENITDEVLSEDVIELKIPKKKKRAKLTQLAIVEDNIREDAYQITEKKKKKKKRETSKESITDKDLSEDIMELKVPKKKKYAKLTQLAIVEDNAHEDTCQIIEKKKKKKKQETSKENITSKDLPENVMELKVPKKKKRAKLTQLAIVEDAYEDMCQITEKKKKKKQKTLNENIELSSEEPLSDLDLKISEKETRAMLRQFAIVKDNIYKNQVNEKEKKKKKQETLKENTKKALSEDVELKISRKRKRGAKSSQLDIVENNTTTREDTYRINEKEKKKKKKRTNELAEQDNINKYVLRKNICKSKTELAQHKKKNKIVDDLELYSPANKQEKRIKKKTKQEETIENIERLRTEKKKKKNTVPVQIPVSKLRSERMSSPNILEQQKTPLEMSELESTAYTTKILDEAIREAKRYLPKKLKPKKKRDRVEDIKNVNVSTKKFKKHKEMNMFLPSSSGLKRLSDDVIENLTDMPTRAKKRKISRNEEQIVSKSSTTNKSKARTINRDDAITLSTSGCTTQFQAVNLQNTKNQPSKEAASFKQLMLARNNRQPISAYMMYREKMRNAK